MGKLKLRRCEDIQELKADFRKIESVVADDTKFIAEALLFIAEMGIRPKRRKRVPTEYAVAIGKFLKEGKGIKEAHRLAKKEVRHSSQA